jgi:integral membrane protein
VGTILTQLRVLAIIEGISYISFGLTMPLKYIYGIKEPNMVVGMIHGVLFILYCVWVLLVYRKHKLAVSELLLLLVASLVPFMTFWADHKILKPLASRLEEKRN